TRGLRPRRKPRLLWSSSRVKLAPFYVRGLQSSPRIGGSRQMNEEDAGALTRTSRVIRGRPEELYEAFTDPAALVAWLPPAEMTGEIHEFDARVGGGYRMSLFHPSN